MLIYLLPSATEVILHKYYFKKDSKNNEKSGKGAPLLCGGKHDKIPTISNESIAYVSLSKKN
jgi:hypothetical protein